MATTEVQRYEGAKNRGLEGVVVCDTAISSIVGSTLQYRGYAIEDLAAHATFEECAYLLWYGKLPSRNELKDFAHEFRSQMALPPEYSEILRALSHTFPKDRHPMHFLRTAVSALSFVDIEGDTKGVENRLGKSLRLSPKLATIVAAFHRMRQGFAPLAPDASKSVAWNFLNMTFGRPPSERHERIFDTALVLHADHEINCSTFTTRVVSSSLSDVHSAITAAIGALKGPLHGGANEAVMKMLLEIGTVDRAKEFVEQALADKQKVMGIGHRIYKNGDPRAKILQKMSEELTREIGKPELYEMSVLIDKTMLEKKGLMPNVDFYSATVYYAMGIPVDLYTPIFAVSRVVGWCAHALEQMPGNRIYRPLGNYIGPKDQPWLPIDRR